MPGPPPNSLRCAAVPPECTIFLWRATLTKAPWPIDALSRHSDAVRTNCFGMLFMRRTGTLIALTFLCHCSIVIAQSNIRVASPNGAEQYRSWDTVDVRWQGVDSATAVDLDFSSDAGYTWQTVADGARGNSHAWVVPNRRTSDYLLRTRVPSVRADALGVLNGHSERVTCVAFSHDGTRLATTSYDNSIQLWDAATGKSIGTLRAHTGDVYWCAFSSDDRYLVAASQDKTVSIWDPVTGDLVRVLFGHTKAVVSAAFNPNGASLATASDDGTIRLWSTATWKTTATLPAHIDGATSVAYDSTGMLLVTAGKDGWAKVWDVGSMNVIAALPHPAGVLSACFSPSGRQVLTACRDSLARIWNVDESRAVRVLRGHRDWVTNATYSHDGRLVATTSRDGTVKLWDPVTADVLATMRDHNAEVSAVAFDAGDRRLASSGSDMMARTWSIAVQAPDVDWSDTSFTIVPASLELVQPNGGDTLVPGSVERVVWRGTAPGDSVALDYSTDDGATWQPVAPRATAYAFPWHVFPTASTHCIARVVAHRRAEDPLVLRAHDNAVMGIAVDHAGRRIVTASADNTAIVWDATSGRPIVTLSGHTRGLMRAVFSPNDSVIVTASRDTTVRIWNAQTGALIRTLRLHKGPINDIAFSADGSRLATASEDGTGMIVNASTWGIYRSLRGHQGGLYSIAFSPSGKYLLTAGRDSVALLWDTATWQVARRFAHPDVVHDARFSPDGTRIITACRDMRARLFTASSGALIATLAGHTGWVWRAAFSPDGLVVATAGRDGRVILSTADSLHPLATLNGTGGGFSDVVFNGTGSALMAADNNGTGLMWPIGADSLIDDRSDSLWTIVPPLAVQGAEGLLRDTFGARCIPQPASNEASLHLELPRGNRVHVSLMTALGAPALEVLDASLPAGPSSLFFDVTHLPSGLYICTIDAGDSRNFLPIIVRH